MSAAATLLPAAVNRTLPAPPPPLYLMSYASRSKVRTSAEFVFAALRFRVVNRRPPAAIYADVMSRR